MVLAGKNLRGGMRKPHVIAGGATRASGQGWWLRSYRAGRITRGGDRRQKGMKEIHQTVRRRGSWGAPDEAGGTAPIERVV